MKHSVWTKTSKLPEFDKLKKEIIERLSALQSVTFDKSLFIDMSILKEAQSAAAELLRKDRFLEAEEHFLLKEHISGYLEGKTLEI